MAKGKIREEGSKEVKVFVTSGGKIFTEEDLKRYEIPASKQIDLLSWQGIPIIEPPYDLSRLMAWLEVSIPHSACVHTKVQDAVGIGWHLERVDEGAPIAEKDRLEDFFNNVNDDEDIITMSKKVFLDYEGCGNGYIEVIRDIEGHINAMYHIPAVSVRVHKSKKLYIQRVGGKTVWFKKFGDDRIIDNTSGLIAESLDKPEKMANEVIHLKNYTWRSAHYGLPDWLPAVSSMLGEMKEKEYNLNFFTSFGIPAYAVLLKNMDLTPEIEDTVKKYFETEIKENPHRTMVFSLPQGAEMTFEPLNIQTKEASFRVYKRDNRDDVLTAHRVPPYRAGLVIQGQLSGGVATEVDRIYLTSVIDPKQQSFEWLINNGIIKQGLESEGWKFQFDDIVIDNRLSQAQIDQIYSSIGVRSANEIRKDLGLDPYEGGDVFYIGGLPSDMAQAGAGAMPFGAPAGSPGSEAGAPVEGAQDAGFVEPAKRRSGITIVGKSKVYEKFVAEKARTRRYPAEKELAKVELGYTKDLSKEFQRQGKDTMKFLEDGNILQAIEADAREKNPEVFKNKRRGKFYEKLTKASREDYARMDDFLKGWRDGVKPEKVKEIFKTWNKKAGQAGGLLALQKMGINIAFNLKNSALIKKLEQRGDKIVGHVTDKTLDDMRNILVKKFYDEGAGYKEVGKALEGLFEETYENRARVIGRTETGIAQAETQFETYKKNGVKKKMWSSFRDSLTRESHLQADEDYGSEDSAIPFDEPFEVEAIDGVDKMMFPKDPDGSPENVINCRCGADPVISEEGLPAEGEEWTGE